LVYVMYFWMISNENRENRFSRHTGDPGENGGKMGRGQAGEKPAKFWAEQDRTSRPKDTVKDIVRISGHKRDFCS
jgi:hypothetical protein